MKVVDQREAALLHTTVHCFILFVIVNNLIDGRDSIIIFWDSFHSIQFVLKDVSFWTREMTIGLLFILEPEASLFFPFLHSCGGAAAEVKPMEAFGVTERASPDGPPTVASPSPEQGCPAAPWPQLLPQQGKKEQLPSL